MTLWHSKEIDVSLQISKQGVDIFPDVECIAHVDYDAVDGDIEWELTGFEFQRREWENGKSVVVASTMITKGDGLLFGLLKSALEDDQITESLAEEFSYSRDDDSGLVNRAWVNP